jgi:alpha-galactosidase
MACAPRDDSQLARNRAWAGRAFSGQAGAELPFSFVFDGRHSREFIGTWKRSVTEQKIDVTRTKRTLILTDPTTGLKVTAEATIYADTPGVDWTIFFTNRGRADTPLLEDIRSVEAADSLPDAKASVVVHRLNGGPARADDWLPFDEGLAAGQKIEFAATDGRSSNVCPFFNVSWGTGGLITAIGWSGQWAAGVERSLDGILKIRAGIETAHLRLHPGETIRGPRILQIRWAGIDPADSYNLFRHTMFAHIIPRIDGQLVTPPVTTPSPWAVHEGDPWKYIYGFKESDALDEIKYIAGLGYEYYWTDAYFTRGNFPEGMGNYGLPIMSIVPDPQRFPRGLGPISDASHQAGMKYVVWFEPERVAPGTYIAKEHPDYVIWPDGKGSGLLNLGLPLAREYITRVIGAALDEWKIDCLRIDYNIDPLPFWRKLDKEYPDRAGMAEIRYVEGLYRMWDDILKAHPHLFIDNCASGGRRIDVETCSRSISLWRTDGVIGPYLKFDYNQTAIQNQVMSAGLNRYIPWSTSGSIGAKPYYFRSGFNYGVPIAERPLEDEREMLKQGIAEGKRLRKYWFGDFYPLSRVTMSPGDWCVWQYHRPKDQDGMIMAFRRQESSDGEFLCPEVRGIDPGADYSVTYSFSYEPAAPVVMKGSALKVLKIAIDARPGSVVIEYRRL